MLGFIQRHPIMSAIGGVVLLYVLYKILGGGGGGGQTYTYQTAGADSGAVASAQAMYEAQLNAAASTQNAQLAYQAQNEQIGAALAAKEMETTLGLAQIEAGRDIASQQTAAAVEVAGLQAQSVNLANTLQAQIQESGIHAQTELAQISAHTTEQQVAAMKEMNAANVQGTVEIVKSQGATQVAMANAQKRGGLLGFLGCFISTAACEHMGMPDDCPQLQSLRHWRDVWVSRHLPDVVNEYYTIAPGIVSRLNMRPDAAMLYKLMWFDFIVPTTWCIDNGHPAAAFAIYQYMVNTYRQIADSTAGVVMPSQPKKPGLIIPGKPA